MERDQPTRAEVLPDTIAWDRLPRLVGAAERALGRLAQVLSQEGPVIEAWLERALVEEAAAQVRLNGLVAKPDRILLVSLDATPSRGGLADRMGVDYLEQLRFLSTLGPDAVLNPDALRSLRFQVRREVWIDGPTRGVWLLDEDPDDSPQRISDWLAVVKRLAHPADGDPAVAELFKRAGLPVDSSSVSPVLALGLALRAWHKLEPLGSRLPVVGRAMLGALAVRLRLLSRPWLFLSEGFTHRPERYMPGGSDINSWLAVWCEAVARGATSNLLEIERLSHQWEELQEQSKPARRSSRLPLAAASLFRHQVVTTASLRADVARASRRSVTTAGALNFLRELTEKGIAQEISGRRSFRLWAIRRMDLAPAEGLSHANEDGDLERVSLGAIRPKRRQRLETGAQPLSKPFVLDETQLHDLEQAARDADEASDRVARLLASLTRP